MPGRRQIAISTSEYQKLLAQRRIKTPLSPTVSSTKTYTHARAGKAKGGKRKDLGGIYFRSAWEANYARYLNFQGIIWRYEPKVFLFPVKRGVTEYRPDFYLPTLDEYHEVKGWMDQRSKTALKRFAKYYPEEKLILITGVFFARLRKQGFPALITGWE